MDKIPELGYWKIRGLPYYIDGDVKITQSNAILKHIARKHSLDGDTAADKAMVDMLLDQAMDLRKEIDSLCYHPYYEDLKLAYFKNLPTTLALFEKRLQGREWFVGSKMSVADFPLYELLYQLTRMKPGVMDAYPNITAFLDKFSYYPKLRTYLSNIMSIPFNNKNAQFK